MKPRKKIQIDSDQQSQQPDFSMLNSIISIPQRLAFDQKTPTSQRLMNQNINQIKRYRKGKTSIFIQKTDEPLFKNKLIERYNTAKKTKLITQTQKVNYAPFKQGHLNVDQAQFRRNKKKLSSFKFVFEKNNILEQKIKTLKIKNMQKLFINKLSRSCITSKPVDLTAFEFKAQDTLLNSKGIQLPLILSNIMNFVSIILIFFLIAIYTISLVFENIISQGTALSYVQIGGLCFYIIEIFINLISVKYEAGKKIDTIQQIMKFYASKGLWVDLISVFILIIDVSFNFTAIYIFRLFIIFKLPQCTRKIEKLQVNFIQNIYNEQYWELVKVILFNFCYAHMIALFLAAMAALDHQNNWMTIKNIEDVTWAQQYIWSFYWATNIMLTVGFGDIAATNTRQAVCLIIIQTFSCIVMAYNVNCMGTIITKIRSQDQVRSKKFKVFKKLADNSSISQQLTDKINNYIEESSNLKKIFNYQEEKQFLNDLPVTLKTNFLKQSNKLVFKNLIFFKNLLEKTLLSLAQVLSAKISHPQQIIRALDDDFNLLILKKGSIGYTCKKGDSKFNDRIIDLITINDNQHPFLTSLDFISKKKPLYQIKSLTFSVIYLMEFNNFISVFRQNNLDYQLYCFLRDKIKNIPDQFQVFPCQLCNKKFNHFKFSCPKLHYAPFQQHIINKEIHRQKTQKSKRIFIKRSKPNLINAIDFYRKIKSYQKAKNTIQSDKKNSSGTKLKQKKSLLQKNDPLEPQQIRLLKQVGSFIFLGNSNLQTKELIQLQFLKDKKEQLYKDQIWTLQLDEMKDYSSYFKNHNPSTLSSKFDPNKRIIYKSEDSESQNVISETDYYKKTIEI